VAKLGAGTQAKHCWSQTDCDALLKYTDGKDLITLAFPESCKCLSALTITRGGNVSQIAHFRAGTQPIADWRWEGLQVFAMPPVQIKGWPVCDDGWIHRGYCGGGVRTERALVVEYSIRHGIVTKVIFGTE
jgi:hypothetical protein